MSTSERLAKLEAENAELRARLEKLEPPKEAKAEPFKDDWKPRRDLTEGMSMDRQTMLEFGAAASAGGIANDAWRSTQPSSIIPQEGPKVEVVRGSGWQKERPIEGPPGVKIIDQMLQVEDEMWRRDRAKQFGQVPKKEGE